MSDSPALSSFTFTGIDPACLRLSFCVSTLVNSTIFWPRLRVCLHVYSALHSPVTLRCFLPSTMFHDYFCSVVHELSIKLFINCLKLLCCNWIPTHPCHAFSEISLHLCFVFSNLQFALQAAVVSSADARINIDGHVTSVSHMDLVMSSLGTHVVASMPFLLRDNTVSL